MIQGRPGHRTRAKGDPTIQEKIELAIIAARQDRVTKVKAFAPLLSEALFEIRRLEILVYDLRERPPTA